MKFSESDVAKHRDGSKIVDQQFINRWSPRSMSGQALSNEQIADSLGQPLSSICARINELKKIDLVIDSGKRTKSKYNKDVILWQRKDQLKSKEI